MLIAALALAGALGAVARHAVTDAAGSAPERRAVAVLVINVAGSALLGAVVGLARAHGLGPDAVVIVGAGLCGGFTTFSAYTHLTVLLVGGGGDELRGVALRTAVAGLVISPLVAGIAFAAASA